MNKELTVTITGETSGDLVRALKTIINDIQDGETQLDFVKRDFYVYSFEIKDQE